jgi:hypothetical protein
MQQIPMYLYPNRVQVLANLETSNTEWKIMYQRIIKFYQGMTNTIEFDIKNAQQRKINIFNMLDSGSSVQCVIMDQWSQEVYTVGVFPVYGTANIARATVPASVFAKMNPQFLKYSVYFVDDMNVKTPLYADAQFGMIGTIELIGGAIPTALEPRTIDTFYTILENDSTQYYNTFVSEAIEVNPLNALPNSSTIALEFWTTDLQAEMNVQISDAAVISSATKWKTIERFDIAPSTTRVNKLYSEIADYSNNIGWLRVRYSNLGNLTGRVDKILVRI